MGFLSWLRQRWSLWRQERQQNGEVVVEVGRYNLPLIETRCWAGFYLSDVRKVFSKRKWKKFCRWFAGQTGVLHKGKTVVYRWDLERLFARAGAR